MSENGPRDCCFVWWECSMASQLNKNFKHLSRKNVYKNDECENNCLFVCKFSTENIKQEEERIESSNTDIMSSGLNMKANIFEYSQ